MPLPPHRSNLASHPLLRDLVRQIHVEPFVRREKSKGKANRGVLQPVIGAPTVTGWDGRLGQFAYAKSASVCLDHVRFLLDPIRADLRGIVAGYQWQQVTAASMIATVDLRLLELHAQTIHMWGGVSEKWGFSDTWKVVKSAALGQRCDRAPMDSGWTKVASLATDTLPGLAQTIWDSRVSTSVVSRLDALGAIPADPAWSGLSVVLSAGSNGTRPRRLVGNWITGSCSWSAHFAGSAVVRSIVDILNDPRENYPRMPVLGQPGTDWDVFGVGLVLFMDGY